MKHSKKMARKLASRIKSWENIQDRNKSSYKRPGSNKK